MKKLKINTLAVFALYAILLAVFSSCNVSSEEPKNQQQIKIGDYEYTSGLWNSMYYKIQERTIDSCQYIIIFGVEGRNIIHKANCRNTNHYCQ